MKTKPMWTVLAVLVIVVLAGLVTAQAERAMLFPQTKVAVVNVNLVFDKAKEAQTLSAQNKQQMESFLQELRSKRDDLQNLQEELELMVEKDAPAYRQRMEQYERKALEIKVETDFLNNKMARLQAIQLQNLYRRMTESIDRVASSNEIDLVMVNEPDVRFDNDPNNVRAKINVRKVLWARNSIDITDQIITDMDLRFQN